jgi:hypothetical protein
MFTLSIEIEGKTVGDLVMAIDEAKKAVEQGYQSGSNENDTGSYSFTRSGEDEEDSEEEEG